MLFNPYQDGHLIQAVPGTRILHDQFGLPGASFEDPRQSGRIWKVSTVYSPLSGRVFGGLRIRVVDNKDFVSFINQRDFELLIDLARPGEWCAWTNDYYPGINDERDGWFGLTMDTDDLEDDLFERELMMRAQQPGQPLQPGELIRLIHLDHKSDYEQVDMLLWDANPDTGLSPDPCLETLPRRWKTMERNRVTWERM